MWTNFVVIAIIGLFLEPVLSLRCYTCMHPQDTSCINVNSNTPSDDCWNIPNPVCYHATNFVGNYAMTQRSCGMQGFCQFASNFKTCTECNSNYCNSGRTEQTNLLVLMVSLGLLWLGRKYL